MRLGTFAVLVLSTLVLVACGSDTDSTSPGPGYEAALDKAPPPLADLYADGDALIGSDEGTYDAAIAGVEGYPIVVNNWASWCIPCREEFPYFQNQANENLDEIAFLGVVSEDATEAADTYLESSPLPYPSVEAPEKGEFGKWVDTTLVGLPNTLFYDSEGELVYTHQGPYTSEDDLAADIAEYAVGS